MILKIRSMQPGENWHYVNGISHMIISNLQEEAYSHFKRRVFKINDVVTISGGYTWEEVDGRKGMKDPDSPTYDPSKDPQAPGYTGPYDLSDEEVKEKSGKVPLEPGVGVIEARLKMLEELQAGKKYERVVKFYEATCTNENGDEFSVFFDGYAYLINDQGKTVDRFEAGP